VVNHFINHPDPLVVPVYSWEDYYPNSKWYEYSYTMKRLGILSQEEKRIISLCIYHKTKFLSNNFLSEFKGEEINYPDLINFMYHVLSQNRYIDLHSQNFLKDEFGDYKLIDVEGFLTFPVDHRNLDWIKYEAS
jgi:hypothetical protein